MSGRRTVLLVGVAVLLVALYVVAVAGRDPGRGDATGRHGFVSWLGGFTGTRSGVPAGRVTADCPRTGDSLRISGACVLHVADPGSMKLLRLRSGAAFRVTAPGPGAAGGTATDDVRPDDTGVARVDVAVDHAVDVGVACLAPTPCTVTIGDR